MKIYAWYNKIQNKSTHPVERNIQMVWGLYDMAGNVSLEWCEDDYDPNF